MGLIVLQLMVRLALRLNDTAHTAQIYVQGEMIEYVNYRKRQAACFPTNAGNARVNIAHEQKSYTGSSVLAELIGGHHYIFLLWQLKKMRTIQLKKSENLRIYLDK